jgi:hypothetical protein
LLNGWGGIKATKRRESGNRSGTDRAADRTTI